MLGNIDDDMILHARQHRKATPVWIRWASVAAVLFCAVILLAVILARFLSGPEGTNPDLNQPDVLAPGIEESKVESIEDTAESSLETEQVSPEPSQIEAPAETQEEVEPQTSVYETIPAEPLEPASESAASPSEPQETPDGSELLSDETKISVAGVTFGMNDTDVIALLGEPDSSEYYDTEGGQCRELIYFGTISYFFSECETCGEYHLSWISELSGGNRMYPYGVTLDDSLSDVLDILGAEDFDTSVDQRIYTLDDSHYASIQGLYDNPLLHFINVYIGDIVWEMTFGRQDQLNINTISIIPERGIHDVHTQLANPT